MNENPKIAWTFEDEELKGEEGWTMHKDERVKKILCSQRHTLSLHPGVEKNKKMARQK